MTAPKDAATVILVRAEGSGGFAVYFTRRPATMRFAGGHFVFPGGQLDEADFSPENLARVRGLGPEEADRLLPDAGGPARALGLWVAAIRELFEEAGVLLCGSQDGDLVDGREEGIRGRLEDYRVRLQARTLEMREVLGKEGLWYRADRLKYVARWITPSSSPIRFDARFFLALLPPEQEPGPLFGEVVEAAWHTPRQALARWERGEILLRPPTVATVRYLAQFPSLAALLEHHADSRQKFDVIPI